MSERILHENRNKLHLIVKQKNNDLVLCNNFLLRAFKVQTLIKIIKIIPISNLCEWNFTLNTFDAKKNTNNIWDEKTRTFIYE